MTVFCQVKWRKGIFANLPNFQPALQTLGLKKLLGLEPVTLEGGPPVPDEMVESGP